MKAKELLSYFKYFKGEKQNPFAPKSLANKWWEGERMLFEKITEDNTIWDNIMKNFREAIEQKAVFEHLIDENISMEQRAIYFYLDLWNGKNYPYDSLDDIFAYVKAE